MSPAQRAVLDALAQHPDGLTSTQIAAITKYTVRTVRQTIFDLRKAGHRIGADRVFRVRRPS